MKNQLEKYESKAIHNEDDFECGECDIGFKSQYHLENHMKGTQHSIKTSINQSLDMK